MSPLIPDPIETVPRTNREREEPPPQQARHGAVTRRMRRIAAAVLVLAVVALAVSFVVGPVRAVDWVWTYLVPVAMVIGGIVSAFALLLWAFKRLPESPLRDWYQ